MKIHKELFDLHRLQQEAGLLFVPKGGRILTAQTQVVSRYQRIAIWFSVVGDTTKVNHYAIHGVTTGEEVPDEWAEHYVSTLQFGDGAFILHIFAVPT